MPCQAELERQRLLELYRSGRDLAEENPGYAGGTSSGMPFPVPGFPGAGTSTPTAAPQPTPAPAPSAPANPPTNGTGGGMSGFPGNWTTAGTWPGTGMPRMPGMPGFGPIPGMPDWYNEMMQEMFGGMPGMPGFGTGTGGGGSGGGGWPGVTASSDGTNGPQSQSSFSELTWDSEKDEPGKKNWTSPDGNSFISINVDYGDEGWEDPFEGQGKTGGGGYGDPDPSSGSAPPGSRGPGGWQTYDENAWGGRQGPQFRDRADEESGNVGGQPRSMNAGRSGTGGGPAGPSSYGGSGSFRGPGRTLG